jgi:two-component system OmpR family sensor kinase
MIQMRSLRVRMMLLFCIVVAILLTGTFLIIYSIFSREVRAQVDRRLLEAAKPMVADIVRRPEERENISWLDIRNEYLEILDSSGRILNLSKNLQGQPLDLRATPTPDSGTVFRALQDPTRGPLRVAIVSFRIAGKPLALVIAETTSDTQFVLGHFRRILLILLVLSLLLTAVTSAWYVGQSLQPINELTRHAAALTRRISDARQQELHAMLTVRNPRDELGRLSATFNELFVTVNAVLNQLRQFVSDASHELRTPLAVLQGETELLLSETRSPEEYQRTLRVIDSELKTLSRIVTGLFTLSLADAGQLRLGEDRVYLDEVLEEACAVAGSLARTKHIAIHCELTREFVVLGDESMLRELFLIFLENAVKYSPAHTQVSVRLERADGFAVIVFQDQGAGISEEHLPHIFERFYRAADTDAGETKSGGLGLAIALGIVRAQSGSIACETSPHHGSKFTVRLPVRTASVAAD